MLSPQDADDFMAEQGFTLYCRNGDNTSRTYNKNLSNGGMLSCECNLVSSDMKLTAMIGLLTLSTGNFAFGHPRFKELFVAKMIQVLDRCYHLI